MNIKLILAGSGAALVPVVAVPTALSLSNNTSTEKSPELSRPERSSVPDLPVLSALSESRDASVTQLPDKFPPPPHYSSPQPISTPSFRTVSYASYPTTLTRTSNEPRIKTETQTLADPLRKQLSDFGSSFSYEQINKKTGDRPGQFKLFVEQTDQLRQNSKQAIKDLLDREEFKNKNFQAIFGQDLGFELLATHNKTDYGSFINLAIFRESEIEAQIEKDKPKKDAQPTKIGNNTTHEDILKFCKDPSEANSHLGMHSSSRTREEETKEYRFFTYYSYCQKGSFYLNKDLKLDPIPAPNI